MEKRIKIGLTPKGGYDALAEYDYLDFVTSDNAVYVSLRDKNQGHSLGDGSWWQKMTEGVKGPKGEDGRLKKINHGKEDTIFELTPNVLHVWGEVEMLTLSLAPMEEENVLAEYCFQFSCPPDKATTLFVPQNIKWYEDYIPTVFPGMTYQASILENVIMLGGVKI